MCGVKLTLDGTKTIISFKGLRGTSKYRWLEEDEVLNAHNHIALTSGILLNELQKACLIMSIFLASIKISAAEGGGGSSSSFRFRTRSRFRRTALRVPPDILCDKNQQSKQVV